MVIVIKVQSEKGERIMGIIVDAVAETYSLATDQIQVSPQIGGVINSEFITGLVAHDDKMIVLMDIDQLMNSGELAVAAPVAG
nr:chemotaxis protein CheW [Aliamphritea spongicola]